MASWLWLKSSQFLRQMSGNTAIGGILNGGGSGRRKPASDIGSWLAMAESFYNESISSTGIPVIWVRMPCMVTTTSMVRPCFRTILVLVPPIIWGLMRDIGVVTAREVAVTGIDWVFAPTVAVDQGSALGLRL